MSLNNIFFNKSFFSFNWNYGHNYASCDELSDYGDFFKMSWKNIFLNKSFLMIQIGTMAITTRVGDELSDEVMSSLVQNVMEKTYYSIKSFFDDSKLELWP